MAPVLPPNRVSRNRKVKPEDAREVSVAVITYDSDQFARCSCGGWKKYHPRTKVLEDAIDRHLTKRHEGRGIRI